MQEGLSYIRGAAVPLIEKTISAGARRYRRAKFPDHEALVACHQGVRLTWSELDREATRTARGLAGLGLRPGDRAGIWASNCAGVGPAAVRRRARRRRAGQRESGVPLARAALRAEEVAHPRAVPAREGRARQLPRDPGRIAQRRRPAAGTRRLAGRRVAGTR